MSRYSEAWPTAGPTWLVDAQGRVLGFRDRLGNDYQMALQAIAGGAETIAPGTILGPGGGGSLFTSSTNGVVPASGGGTTAYLRADGTWQIPPVGPTYSSFSPSVAGLAPASGGGTSNYLRADGTWSTPPVGPTYVNFTSTVAGLVPLSGGGTTNFLRADGAWSAPPGGITTFAGLSDKATVDLTTVNTPLAGALSTLTTNVAAKATLQVGSLVATTSVAPNSQAVKDYVDTAISAIPGGNGQAIDTTFSQVVSLDKTQGREMNKFTQTSNLVFSVASNPAAVVNGNCTVTVAGDAFHSIDISAFNNPNNFVPDPAKYNFIAFVHRPDGHYVFGALGATVPQPDAILPLISTATAPNLPGNQIELLFDSDMDQTQDPTNFFAQFTISSGHTLTASAWGSTIRKLLLTTSTPFLNGESAKTLSFTQTGSINLQKANGNKLASVASKSITNQVNALPTIIGVSVANATPSTIVVQLSEAYTGTLPASTAFAVSSGHAITAIAAGASGDLINLSTSTPFVNGEVVTLAYTKPGTNPITGGTSLQQLASVSGLAITDNVQIPATLTSNITTISSTINLTTIGTLDWTKTLFWNENGNNDDRKSGANLITRTLVNCAGSAGDWIQPATQYNWSNGSPYGSHTSADASTGGNSNAANKFPPTAAGVYKVQYNYPASQTSHVASIMLRPTGVALTIRVTLSDGSAGPLTITTPATSGVSYQYDFTYLAGSTCTLTVSVEDTATAAGTPDRIAIEATAYA